jgi:glycosyltransferase involved in cell wall biosynthesis
VRIALVVPGGVDRSGERRVIPAVLALIERVAARHDLHVFALAQEKEPGRWRLKGAEVHNTGAQFTVLRTIAAMRREHARARFDVVHCLWAGASGFAGTVAAVLLDVPCLTHLAGGELAALPAISYGGRLRLRWRVLDSWSLRRAALVTAASAPLIELAAAHGISARRVPLGVALDRWPSMPPRRRARGEVARLIHVASLNPVKDQPTLIRAMHRLSANGHVFRLDIVGEDTLRGEMQALTLELGLGGHVFFHGFLTQSELRPLMEMAHVNVVSSLYEAGPLVVLEAAVAGVPTAGTEVGHVAEWTPDAALCVPVGDAAALADAISLLIVDDDLRVRVANAAMQRAVAEDADFTAQRFHEAYRSLADS